MNRLFEDVTERRAHGEAQTTDDIEAAEWYPAADLYDQEQEYSLALDLPGIDRSTLEITVDDNRLTIKGTRVISETATSRSERPSGRFSRAFNVPGSVDQKSINATYKDGVLRVRLPKRKEETPKRIEIKVS
ncbi:MAG TPA: Hsp20/alpha crystallin family protein [Pyrinomonadaceae bacterium]|nr:Hsp20/alpha crystallin family protein [Pyrinomonadaceae bacterium]